MLETKAPATLKVFNGRYTAKNRVTGQHRTFEIKTQAADAKFAPGERIVSLLTGPNNEADYTAFGFATDHGIAIWKSKRGQGGTKSEWEWYGEVLWSLALDSAFSPFADRYEFLLEGRCLRCNRVLTTPESVLSGIGPVCAGRDEAENTDGEPDFEALYERHLDDKAIRDTDSREEGGLA